MTKLNLEAKTQEQQIIKEYIENNASESLAEKVNTGCKIVKDNKTLTNKKTLDGFIQYATEQARKLAEKGASCACVKSDIVFGWAIHYFEEDDIIGTLYNEDGSEYSPKPIAAKPISTTKPITKQESKQPTLFDLMLDSNVENKVDKTDLDTSESDDQTEFEEDEINNLDTSELRNKNSVEIVESKIEQQEVVIIPKTSPIYQKYMGIQNKYLDSVVAMQLGDFYEVFGDKAKDISKLLDLTLISRDFGLGSNIPLCGFPYKSADSYFDEIKQHYSLVVVDSDSKIKYYEAHSKNQYVDTETGEVINEVNSNNFVAILQSIFNNELEIKL